MIQLDAERSLDAGEPEGRAGSRVAPALALGLVLAAVVLTGHAGVPPAVTSYDDCRALRSDYPAGVVAQARGDLYRANRGLDADGDGVACGPSLR